MSTTATAPVVDAKVGPGHRIYVKTKANVPAEALWAALKDFSDDRPTLWPLIARSLYRQHNVGEGEADVTEGSKFGPKGIWARERYEWGDATMDIRATVVESNFFKPGGTARLKVTPTEDGGAYLEEWYERERIGLVGKVMNRVAPRMLPKFIGKGRARTIAVIAERARSQPLQ